MSKAKHKEQKSRHKTQCEVQRLEDGDKNWVVKCEVCGQLPTVHPTGLCGPCCFGESETVGGNW